MSAPRDVQQQVASLIPLSRFGGRTQKLLAQQYGPLDKTATLGALDAKYSGGSGGIGSDAVASGTAGAVADNAAPAAPATSWFGSLVNKPDSGGKSPLEAAAAAFTQGPQKMKEAEQDQAPERVKNDAGSAPPARNVSPGLQNVAQTYGQTLNSFNQPLTWTSAPPGAPQMPAAGLQQAAGSQVPGISLASFQTPSQGLGYGVNPVGYGFG
jgi:hypothetical protein